MNKKSYELLSYISRYSKDGGKIVFDVEDLKTNTGKFPLTSEELLALIERFTLTEQIKVSYSDGKSFCIALLTKGRLAIDKETAKSMEQTVKIDINYKKIFYITLLGGFLGSLLCFALTTLLRSIF